MRFKATFQKPRVDMNKWRRELDSDIGTALELAVVAWLNAATAPIPAWSGASLGTFSELASRVNFALAIQPTPLGAQMGLGASAGRAASKGTLTNDPKTGLYQAEYSTSLEHLIFNEFNNANAGGDDKVFARLRNPGPYGFLSKGNAAFTQAASQATLPKVTFKTTKREVR
jgi:hypothetical protein